MTYSSAGDIAPGDYQLDYDNETDTSVLLYWTLEPVIYDMIENDFIIGFDYSIEYINSTSIRNFTSLNTTLILHDLSPQQWYVVIARLVTTDHDSWGPQPLRIHFQTLES